MMHENYAVKIAMEVDIFRPVRSRDCVPVIWFPGPRPTWQLSGMHIHITTYLWHQYNYKRRCL